MKKIFLLLIVIFTMSCTVQKSIVPDDVYATHGKPSKEIPTKSEYDLASKVYYDDVDQWDQWENRDTIQNNSSRLTYNFFITSYPFLRPYNYIYYDYGYNYWYNSYFEYTYWYPYYQPYYWYNPYWYNPYWYNPYWYNPYPYYWYNPYWSNPYWHNWRYPHWYKWNNNLNRGYHYGPRKSLDGKYHYQNKINNQRTKEQNQRNYRQQPTYNKTRSENIQRYTPLEYRSPRTSNEYIRYNKDRFGETKPNTRSQYINNDNVRTRTEPFENQRIKSNPTQTQQRINNSNYIQRQNPSRLDPHPRSNSNYSNPINRTTPSYSPRNNSNYSNPINRTTPSYSPRNTTPTRSSPPVQSSPSRSNAGRK